MAAALASPLLAQTQAIVSEFEEYRNEVVRPRYDSIQERLSDLERTEVRLGDRPLTGFYEEGGLRKAVLRGEDRETSVFYWAGEPFFIMERDVDGAEEHRYYLRDDTLMAWIGPDGDVQPAAIGAALVPLPLEEQMVRALEAARRGWLAGLYHRMGRVGFGGTLAIALLIVGLFVFLGHRYLWSSLRRTSQALNMAASRVSGHNDASEKLFPEGPERLRELWMEFLAQRKDTTVPYNGRKISTVDPAEIFHTEAILDAYNRNFAVTLAGFFTGLGIFGTFFGLVIGLEGLETDSGQLLNSVESLLGGMSAAFYTSLLGIFFSLLWLLLDRVFLSDVQRAENHFFRKVRDKYPVESADRLLHRLLNVEQEENQAIQDSKALLEEQKGILQTLSTDLAVTLQDAFSTSLEQSLAPHLDEMTQAVEALSVQMGERQVEALDEMVASFQEKLSSELHEHLAGLSSGLARAAEWQERVHGQVMELTDRLAVAADRQAELVEVTTSASDSFADSVGALTKVNEDVQASMAAMTEASEGIRGLAAGLGDQTEALDERIGEMKREGEVFRGANEELREHLAAQIDALDDRMADVERLWDGLGERLEEAGRKLQGGAEEFTTLTTQKLQEIFARFDSEMATVVEHLSGTLAEIRDVTDGLPAQVSDLSETLSEQTTGMAGATETMGEAVERLETLEEVLDALAGLEPLATSIDQAGGRIGSAASSFSDLLAGVRDLEGRIVEIAERPAPRVSRPAGSSRAGEAGAAS